MGFHEVRFPENISYGSKGGPGYNTNIIEMDGGNEQAIARWTGGGKHHYDISYGIKSKQDAAIVKTFYIARLGPANGFRFKDWADFTSNTDGVTAQGSSDQIIGSGDGSNTQFQLIKQYTSGDVTRSRTINKPVAGTVSIAFDGVTQGSGWTVNTATGIITFTSAPSAGVQITAGYEFDVPVRFEKDMDKSFAFQHVDFGTMTADPIMVVEVLEPTSSADEFFYGGAVELCLSASYTVSVAEARVYIVAPQTSGLALILEDPADLAPGGPVFMFVNIGPNSIVIKEPDGTDLVTMVSGTGADALLSVDASNNKLYLLS